MKEITFGSDSLRAREHLPRRIGRPKTKWANTERDKLWGKFFEQSEDKPEYNDSLPEHRDRIREMAEKKAKE